MTQQYTPVDWQDPAGGNPGTLINKARLDQMQTAHHYADGFEEVDTVPSASPGVSYHKMVYCTADSTFYRWDGSQWTKDVDDTTKALLEAHEADHANPHVVTKAQVGLGNVDNKGTVSAWQSTPDDNHIPTEKLVKDSLDGKVPIITTTTGIKIYAQTSSGVVQYQGTSNPVTSITSIPMRDSSGRIKTETPSADTDCANKKYVDDGLSVKLDTTTAASTYLTQADAATTYATKSDITAVFKVKGSKASYSDLPATGNVTGDVWNVLDTGSNYVWDGTAWDKLSETVDLSGLVPKTTTVNGHALSSDVTVTKGDVGLGNVDNYGSVTAWQGTPDNSHIPTEKLVKDTLDTKYVKPSGGIPKTDLASGVQTSLGLADSALQSHQSIKTINSASIVGTGNVNLQTPLTAGTDYVVPVAGKGLSTEDFTSAEKSKLAGIASGAEVNVQADWTQADNTKDDFIKNKPTLATVATSGSYNDLTNKPTIPSVPVQDVTVNGTSVLDGTTAKVVVPTTAADVGALPDTTLYAGSSTAGGKATSAASADAVPWSGITGNPLAVTDITLTES